MKRWTKQRTPPGRSDPTHLVGIFSDAGDPQSSVTIHSCSSALDMVVLKSLNTASSGNAFVTNSEVHI
jgi:hypothetical protein